MKTSEVSVDQVLQWVKQIKNNPNTSIATVKDQNGRVYGVKTVTEYVAAPLASLENGNILVDSNQPEVGIRSIKGLQIGINKFLACTELRLLADTSQALETAAAGKTLPWITNATPAIKNAEVRVIQTGELLRTIGSDVTNFKASTGNDNDFRTVVPFVIRGGIDFNINTKLPAGAVVAAGTWIMYQLRCVEFTPAGEI